MLTFIKMVGQVIFFFTYYCNGTKLTLTCSDVIALVLSIKKLRVINIHNFTTIFFCLSGLLHNIEFVHLSKTKE